jgi:hypothetical protein
LRNLKPNFKRLLINEMQLGSNLKKQVLRSHQMKRNKAMTEKLNGTQKRRKRSGGFNITVGMLKLIFLIPFSFLTVFIITYTDEVDDKARPSHYFAEIIKINLLKADFQNIDDDVVNQLIDMDIADDFFKMVDRSDIEFDVIDDGILTENDVLFVVNTILDQYHNSAEYIALLEVKRLRIEEESQAELKKRNQILKAFDKNKSALSTEE